MVFILLSAEYGDEVAYLLFTVLEILEEETMKLISDSIIFNY